MKVWPVRAVGYFNVSVSGILKTGMIRVFDINGRIVRSLNLTNQNQQTISGLSAGSYIVTLSSDKTISQKVKVQ